jgi:hypothetical protein
VIRFIDATPWYWADEDEDNPPCCLFVDTRTDMCIADANGCHVFDDLASVEEIPGRGARCAGLVPPGFFDARPTPTKETT